MPAPLPFRQLVEANNESCSEESKSNQLRASNDLASRRQSDPSPFKISIRDNNASKDKLSSQLQEQSEQVGDTKGAVA